MPRPTCAARVSSATISGVITPGLAAKTAKTKGRPVSRLHSCPRSSIHGFFASKARSPMTWAPFVPTALGTLSAESIEVNLGWSPIAPSTSWARTREVREAVSR